MLGPQRSLKSKVKTSKPALYLPFNLVSSAPTWFEMEENKNRNVYVSGLPLDITVEEFVELMSKCGIVMEDDDGIKTKPLCLVVKVVRLQGTRK